MQAPHYPPLPVVPAPWMAHRCPQSGAVYYVNLQTLATTWTSPVPAPPPEDVPCATCMECPCACAARADEAQAEAQAKALEAVKAHTAAPQKYSHHEQVPVDQSRQGPVCMNQMSRRLRDLLDGAAMPVPHSHQTHCLILAQAGPRQGRLRRF